MIRLDTLTEAIALRMLTREGIAAIWELQLAAGIAYRTGNAEAAACIMEIADAAEREWLSAEQPAALLRRPSTI